MASDAERAVWALEQAVEGLLSFVKGVSYGLRLASKRVGDLTTSGAPPPRPQAQEELERLASSLQRGEDHLSDVLVLALGDHFRAFLARALSLPELPGLPDTPAGVEALAGTPGALEATPGTFALLLALYPATLRRGRLDARALRALGRDRLELPGAGGKVRMFIEGDHVTLTEGQLEDLARAVLEAARGIRLKLHTA